jgi:hypothetical protein
VQLRQKALDLAIHAQHTVVARRAVMTQARQLWQEQITTTHLEVFRKTLTGIGIDEYLDVLASALAITTRIAGLRHWRTVSMICEPFRDGGSRRRPWRIRITKTLEETKSGQ